MIDSPIISRLSLLLPPFFSLALVFFTSRPSFLPFFPLLFSGHPSPNQQTYFSSFLPSFLLSFPSIIFQFLVPQPTTHCIPTPPKKNQNQSRYIVAGPLYHNLRHNTFLSTTVPCLDGSVESERPNALGTLMLLSRTISEKSLTHCSSTLNTDRRMIMPRYLLFHFHFILTLIIG